MINVWQDWELHFPNWTRTACWSIVWGWPIWDVVQVRIDAEVDEVGNCELVFTAIDLGSPEFKLAYLSGRILPYSSNLKLHSQCNLLNEHTCMHWCSLYSDPCSCCSCSLCRRNRHRYSKRRSLWDQCKMMSCSSLYLQHSQSLQR